MVRVSWRGCGILGWRSGSAVGVGLIQVLRSKPCAGTILCGTMHLLL